MSFRELISRANSKALDWLSEYGLIIGIIFSALMFIGLIYSYINSVFIFMFIDGVVNKKISIRKSFSKNNPLGVSLFFFRIVFGLINTLISLLIFSPIIIAFFTTALIYGFSISYIDKYSVVIGEFATKLSIPAIVLILGGILDDKFALKSNYKLAIQILVCILCWCCGIKLNSIFNSWEWI